MRYIDQEKIYDLTESGLTIFQHFFPGEDLRNNKTFFKIRPEEKSASARVSWYQNYWRITDFGNQSEINGMRAIDFAVWKLALPYYDTLLYIEQVIIRQEVGENEYKRKQWTPLYEMREMTPDDKKGEYNFTFKDHPADNDLAAIGRYVTEDILDLFNCKCIEKYEYCGNSKKHNRDVVHIFKATDDYPMFVFDYGDFKKLYRPHDQEKKNRFLYVGKKPKDYIYGLKQLEKVRNEFASSDSEDLNLPEDKPDARVHDLFRCSGESDALNLASLGFNVYWLNSESADLDYKTFRKLDNLCENHYQIMDLDPTGQDQALKNAMKHITMFTVELPSWLQAKRDFRGNPCKDLKDFINLSGEDIDATRYDFLIIKNAARRVKFWTKTVDEKTKKASYNLNMEMFYFFLKANGFYLMESIYHKKAGYCYVHIRGKVVEMIHPDDIKRIVKRFTKDWIKSKKLMDSIHILNKINTSNQITEANIESIEATRLKFKNHDRFTEYIHFRNGSIRIRKDKIERIPHSDVPNSILGLLEINNKKLSHLIDRDIRVIEKPPVEVVATVEYQKLLDMAEAAANDEARESINVLLAQFPDTDKYLVKIHDDEFIFLRFLRDLSRIHWRKETEQKIELTDEERKEEQLALANLLFVHGYHCAQYKDPGKPWLTFLQDMRIGDIGTASGRSGKSLYSQATTYVRTSFYKGGRTLNDRSAYQFFYDGMTEFHDYIEVDDLHEYADFGFFYTQVTGKREVNPKNYTPFTLDYEDSGKMLISSNYELQNVDSSTVGRLLNCGVSDYYHEKSKYNDYHETRSPLIKFGRRLYDDFTDEEWVKFYNLAAYCIQLQMRFYKIQPPSGNLEKRQLRRAMSQGLGRDEEFFRWANDYFILWDETSGYRPEFSPPEHGYFNTYIYRNQPFENFQSRLSKKQQSEYKSGKFKKHLEAWCEYWGYKLNPEALCTDIEKSRILRTIDGKTEELFYISTAAIRSEDMPEQAHTAPAPPEDIDNALPF